MKTHAGWVYHHAWLLDLTKPLSDRDREYLKAAKHWIDLALEIKPNLGELNNAANAEAIKHGS